MNKEEKKNIKIFVGIGICIGILIAILVNVLRVNNITYEYLKDGKFGTSHECYVDKRKDCMCKIDNNFVAVDQFYFID